MALITNHISPIDMFILAIEVGNKQLVEGMLRRKSVSVDEKGSKGETPLTRGVYINKTDMAAILLDNGANINTPNAEGWTPLMIAAWHGCLDPVKLLLERGANPRIMLSDGTTAYNLASECKYHDIADLILKYVAPREIMERGNYSLTRLKRSFPERIRHKV